MTRRPPAPTQCAVGLVTRWVRCYTRHLPEGVVERRTEEIRADLHDHVTHERARGTTDGKIALGVLSRMLRGLVADATWRSRHRSTRGHPVKSFVALLAAALAVAVLGVGAIMYADADDAPGLGLIGFLLIAGAVVVAVRATYRRRRRPAARDPH